MRHKGCKPNLSTRLHARCHPCGSLAGIEKNTSGSPIKVLGDDARGWIPPQGLFPHIYAGSKWESRLATIPSLRGVLSRSNLIFFPILDYFVPLDQDKAVQKFAMILLYKDKYVGTDSHISPRVGPFGERALHLRSCPFVKRELEGSCSFLKRDLGRCSRLRS